MEPSARRRAGVLIGAFGVIFFGLLLRLWAIQVGSHERYRALRDAQSHAVLDLERARGEIRDARGQLLAVSVPVESVWANPSAIENPAAAARILAGVLSLREIDLYSKLVSPGASFCCASCCDFVWIKRKVTSREAEAVRGLMQDPVFKPGRRSPEPRLGLRPEYARRYPHGPLAGQVVGFVSEDPAMHEGMERAQDAWLRGGKGSVSFEVDGRRRALGAPEVPAAGAEVTLTIDLLLQRVVEEELDAACREHHPKWAVAIVLDPRTGAILALASRPAFDPNEGGRAPGASRMNRAVAAPNEPGSTLKPLLAAYAIDRGLATPKTAYDCEMGAWTFQGRTIHDHHPYGRLTLAEGVEKSSNVFAAKLGALTLGRERLYDCMRLFGFGVPTGSGLPAEDDGRLIPLAKWSGYSVTSLPIGHEISITPLQLAAAMAAIANGGTLYRPFIVRRVALPDGPVLFENGPKAVRRVIGSKASVEMIEILKSAVKTGTGRKAQVPGIEVAGKTGTTQKLDPATGRYTHSKFISSFVGFAPADEARVCVAVVIDEPEGAYYGGAVAAPVVGRIVERGLVYVE